MGERNPSRTAADDGAEWTPESVMRRYYGPDREQGALFAQLFTPKSRALILNALVAQPDEGLTVSEIVGQADGLGKSSVHNHIDALVDLDIVVDAGMKGNARTYRLNTAHPIGQLLTMIENVFMWGRTPQNLDEAFLFDGDSDDLLAALEEEDLHPGGE